MLPLTCLFYFIFSSCHRSLLLNFGCLLNLICIFPLLLDWRYFQNCCSTCNKGGSFILLPCFKSSNSVYNIFFPVYNIFFPFNSLTSLLTHCFLCNLGGPHLSAQILESDIDVTYPPPPPPPQQQNHLYLDLEKLCSVSWSNPVNAFSLTLSTCPFPVR